MNSLIDVFTILDADFEEAFNFDDIIINFTNADDAIEDFRDEFSERYNSDNDYIDLGEIKSLLNFDRTMKICEYIIEHSEENGFDWELRKFGDNILKSFIFLYMTDLMGEFELQIEQYFSLPEEEEGEPELPPAQ